MPEKVGPAGDYGLLKVGTVKVNISRVKGRWVVPAAMYMHGCNFRD
jgi:hypothetical protein